MTGFHSSTMKMHWDLFLIQFKIHPVLGSDSSSLTDFTVLIYIFSPETSVNYLGINWLCMLLDKSLVYCIISRARLYTKKKVCLKHGEYAQGYQLEFISTISNRFTLHVRNAPKVITINDLNDPFSLLMHGNQTLDNWLPCRFHIFSPSFSLITEDLLHFNWSSKLCTREGRQSKV